MKIKTLAYGFLAGVLAMGGSVMMPAVAWAEGETESVESGEVAEADETAEAVEADGEESAGEEETRCAADVNGECYGDLAGALAAAQTEDGEIHGDESRVLTLNEDVAEEATGSYVVRRNLMVNMNGHSLTMNKQFIVQGVTMEFAGTGTVNLGAQLPIVLKGATDEAVADDYTHLIVGEGVTLNTAYKGASYAIMMSDKDAKYGVTIDFKGRMTRNSGTTLIGFYINGVIKEGRIVINVPETAVVEALYGAYIAGTATMNFAGTMNVTGTGIEIRAGTLNMTGGAINVSEGRAYQVQVSGSGTTALGAAVAICQHTTKLPLTVNISGGYLAAAMPFSERNMQNNEAEAIAKVGASITGGKFVSFGEAVAISDDLTGFMRGGNYSVAPEERYVAEGHVAYETGATYTVLPEVETDGEDEVNDGESEAENSETLAAVAEAAMKGILANYDSLENIEYTFDGGLKVRIDDAAALKAAIESGKKISATLMKSGVDITDALSAEEVAALKAGMKTGSTVVGIYDYRIILTTEVDGELAHVTELGMPVMLAFDVSGVKGVAEDYARTHQVVRYHEGVAEALEVSHDEGDEVIRFATDKFSSFLIAYIDVFVGEESTSAATVAAGTPNTGVGGEVSNGGVIAAGGVAGAVVMLGVVNLGRNWVRRRIYRR